MQTYELLVKGRAIYLNSDDSTLVRTSIGIDRIHVLFDSREWLSFPLTVTFSQKGVEPVTTSIRLNAIDSSEEWVAEGTTVIPFEVIRMNGPINITFQGTDALGNHIITSKGSPLRVEESGDVVIGDIPEDAPTPDQWHQAYAEAMEAINDVRSVIATLESQLANIVAEAKEALDDKIAESYKPATTTDLGVVSIGDGILVDRNGMISAAKTNGITTEQASQITNFALLASYAFDTEFDDKTGLLKDTVMVKPKSLPIDNKTITVSEDGKLQVNLPFVDTEVF